MTEAGLGGYQPLHRRRPTRRVTPLGCRDNQGVALGDWLVQKLHERGVDARVRHAA
jgi:hypothetical protein